MKKLIFIIAIAVISSCSSTKILVPTQVDVDRNASRFPGLTVAKLDNGKTLFEDRCTQCHGTKSPQAKTDEQWAKTVPRMAKKAEGNKDKKPIDEATQREILQYLISMSGAKSSK